MPMSEEWLKKSYPADLTPEQAEKIVREAVFVHGRPLWLTVIPGRVRRLVPPHVINELLDATVPMVTRRSEKYQYILDWCAENVGEKISTKDFSALHNISYPTALKFISDRPDVFWKAGRGTYEIRDPQKDRESNI